MRSDPYPTYLLAAIAFVAGIAVGWEFATVRAKGGIYVSVAPPGTSTGPQLNITKKTRELEIKCHCGSLMKFSEPALPGFQPYPAGDSIT